MGEDYGAYGDACMVGDGDTGGDGLDCLLILTFRVIFFWRSSGESACIFAAMSLTLLLVAGCQEPEFHIKKEMIMVAFI